MKKHILFILASFISFLIIMTTRSTEIDIEANTSQSILSYTEYNQIKKNLTSQINSIEKIDINISEIEILYDLEINPSYILAKLDEKGYIIATRENHLIVMYDLESTNIPFENISSMNTKIFAGPFSYYTYSKSNNKLTNVTTSKEFSLHNVNPSFIELNRQIISINDNNKLFQISNDSINTIYASYQGLSSSRFSRYKGWINNHYPGRCGTYAAGTMLAYCDDYIDDSFIPSSIRPRNSTSSGSLLTKLYTYIDQPNPNGTIATQVARGVSQFLTNDAKIIGKYSAYYGLAGTWSRAKTVINSGYPIVIGLASILGSSYGDHWVLVYQYYDSGNSSSSYYKCVDNHGEYTASIHVSWTVGYVYTGATTYD